MMSNSQAGVLAEVIALRQILYPRWGVFGTPGVVRVVEAPAPEEGPTLMVRVMLWDPQTDGDTEEDKKFFLVWPHDGLFKVYEAPDGPWFNDALTGTLSILSVGELMYSCREIPMIDYATI